MTDKEFFWLVGLLEGEGSFILTQRSDTRFDPPSYAAAYGIVVVSTDKDVIERAAGIMCSKVYGPYPQRSARHKEYYRAALYKRALVMPLLEKLRPEMSTRRQEQIDRLLQHAAEHPVRRSGPRPKEGSSHH